MPVANPYAEDLGNRKPLEALGDTAERIRQLVTPWSNDQFEKSYAPGKWSARLILVHLAQTELALSTRARFALAQPGYTAQAFSQDDWMPIDHGADRPHRARRIHVAPRPESCDVDTADEGAGRSRVLSP